MSTIYGDHVTFILEPVMAKPKSLTLSSNLYTNWNIMFLSANLLPSLITKRKLSLTSQWLLRSVMLLWLKEVIALCVSSLTFIGFSCPSALDQ